jgi:hypothetical protein
MLLIISSGLLTYLATPVPSSGVTGQAEIHAVR